MFIAKSTFQYMSRRLHELEDTAEEIREKIEAVILPSTRLQDVIDVGNGYYAINRDAVEKLLKTRKEMDAEIYDLTAQRDWYKEQYARLKSEAERNSSNL